LSSRQPDFATTLAFRWRSRNGRGTFLSVRHPHRITLEDLQGVDRQRNLVDQNTQQFVGGLPANNVLLTGARGTGKSSLVKAVLNRYAAAGLRLIELDKNDLLDLPEHPVSERKPGIDAGRCLPYESCAQHQLVADDLRISRAFLEDREKGTGPTHEAAL